MPGRIPACLQLAIATCGKQSRAEQSQGAGNGECRLAAAAAAAAVGFLKQPLVLLAALRPFPALGREMMHKSCVCPDAAAH